MALLCMADGISVVTERIFPDRFLHVGELNRMGARIRKEGATAVVQGVKELQGASIMASDLRASAALVLAGLAAKGTTNVDRVYHIDRGYEKIEQEAQGRRARTSNASKRSNPHELSSRKKFNTPDNHKTDAICVAHNGVLHVL